MLENNAFAGLHNIPKSANPLAGSFFSCFVQIIPSVIQWLSVLTNNQYKQEVDSTVCARVSRVILKIFTNPPAHTTQHTIGQRHTIRPLHSPAPSAPQVPGTLLPLIASPPPPRTNDQYFTRRHEQGTEMSNQTRRAKL